MGIGLYEIAWLFAGYLAGSIPFGLLLTRLAGLGDVRRIGSGNIGATNVLRTGHKGLAAATLALDILKGFLPVLAASLLSDQVAMSLAALGAFLGHVYPVWLGFRGGKGVATFIGILLALDWLLGLAFIGVWLLIAFFFRISSLAALSAALAMPPLAIVLGEPPLPRVVVIVLSIAIFITHHANIRRLLTGTEPRIGGSDEPVAVDPDDPDREIRP